MVEKCLVLAHLTKEIRWKNNKYEYPKYEIDNDQSVFYARFEWNDFTFFCAAIIGKHVRGCGV